MYLLRLFDSLFLIYIYIVKYIIKDVRSERKKKYVVDIEKNRRGLNLKLFK